jgi:hypothetical protein
MAAIGLRLAGRDSMGQPRRWSLSPDSPDYWTLRKGTIICLFRYQLLTTMLKTLDVVAAIIEKDGKILLAQRPAHADQPGMWEFAGGKVEAGETQPEALIRELREELGIDALPAIRGKPPAGSLAAVNQPACLARSCV